MADEPERPEDWAGTARLRYFHYLRRRHLGIVDGKPLSVDGVTKLTRELERLASKAAPTEKDVERVTTVRKLLRIGT